MLRILICDDNAAFAANLREQLRGCLGDRPVSILTYTSMEELPEEVLSACDLAFLDVDFAGKGYTGLDIAGKLRKLRPHAVIIFVTNYIEYAPEGYEVGAFRYILKSELERRLPGYLDQALQRLQSGGETLTIREEGELCVIPLTQIRYLESDGHTVIFHTENGERSTYARLTELEERLEEKGFLRIHKSYLVNMAHLSRFRCSQAVLGDGTELPVSARSYSVQKQKYLLWKGGTT